MVNLQEFSGDEGQDWSANGPGKWSIEASDILGDKLMCPKCNKALPPISNWTRSRDADQDMTDWYLDHGCGAHITIWND